MLHSISRYGALACFACSLALSSAVLAQPEPSTVMKPVPPLRVPEPQSFVRVDALVPAQGAVLFGVAASNMSAANILREVATRSNLQIVVKTGTRTMVSQLSIPPCSLNELVVQVCESVKLSCEKREGIWFVSSPEVLKPDAKERKLDLAFAEIEATVVLGMIAKNFGLKMNVDPAIKNTIPLISLDGRTPRGAVDLVAQAANLDVREEGDTLIVSPKPKA